MPTRSDRRPDLYHARGSILPDVHKIAVLKASALGDFIATTAALRSLRHAYPNAEIVLLGKPVHKALIETRPGPVDRVVVVPVSRGVREEPDVPPETVSQDELDAFFARMQQEKFDLAIQAHGGGRYSNPFVRRLGARVTAGMRAPDAVELDLWMPYVVFQHEFIRPLEVMRLVGAEPYGYDPEIIVTERDGAALRRQLPELRAPYAVIHPGATDPRRRWPADRFALAADALAARGLHIVVTGVESERDVIAAVIAQMCSSAVNACGQLSMSGLVGLLAGAQVVVANDTGPLHLAEAVRTPNVGIFWAGNTMKWSHLSRNIHRALTSWTVNCPLCGADIMAVDPPTDRCAHQACFVDRVTVDEVLAAAIELLAYSPRR